MRIEGTFETDLPLSAHAHVVINGRVYQVSERPAWMSRPRNMTSLWVSEDAARVIEWALTIEGDPEEVRSIYSRRPRKPGEFGQGEAMDQFYGPRNDDDTEYYKARHAWWDEVKTELMDANLLRESGYFAYVPSKLAWETFPPTPETRRLF